jgi:hypothetical protein
MKNNKREPTRQDLLKPTTQQLLENKVRKIYKKILSENFREVKVYFDNGDHLVTSMNGQLTDEEISNYYRVGKSFNLGVGGKDNMTKVKKIEILK